MVVQVVVPQAWNEPGEGVITNWFKREGARVVEGEPVAEVMVEKVNYEVVAQASGILGRILVPKGGAVRPGTPIAEISGEAEAISAAAPPPAPAPEVSVPAFVPASPAARRLAKEHGLDLGKVKGTGPGGRISEEDVLARLETARATRERVVPLVGMRKTIAERMVQSLQTMAQVTLVTEADVSATVELREHLSKEFDVSYTDIALKAAATALAQHPRLNAHLVANEVRLQEEINIGLAVALQEGLVVPVLRSVDRLSLREISAEARRLAERAREGKLTAEDTRGTTFTITNLGMYEVDSFTPIINPPEVAILGLGRVAEKPVVRNGQVVACWAMALSLTFDHRAVDGAPAAEYLRSVKRLLEDPSSLA